MCCLKPAHDAWRKGLSALVTAITLMATNNAHSQSSLVYVGQWEFSSSSAAVLEVVNLARTSTGNVVVPVPGDGAVRVFAPGGGLVAEITGLETPAGVAIDSRGNLFVVESRGQSFRKYAPAGASYTLLARGLGRAQLRYPAAIAITAAGNVFVGDRQLSKILEFDNDGKFLREVATTEGPPVMLAWHSDRGLLVGARNRLIQLDARGQSKGVASVPDALIMCIAFDHLDRLLVSTLEQGVFVIEQSGAKTRLKFDRKIGQVVALTPAGAEGLYLYDVTGFRVLRFKWADAGR